MINSLVEFTIWNRTATFMARSLLSLAYCLIVVLGGMLITNESHARTCLATACLENSVIVQNAGKQGEHNAGRYIRKEPRIDPDTYIDTVYDGYTGIVTHDLNRDDKYIETDGKYVWYYVKWDDLGKKGWIAGISSTYKYIATMEEDYQKNVIVKALFNSKNHATQGDVTHEQTNHDYNDYKCNANWIYDKGKNKGKLVYKGGGGHAGWDVQTQDKSPNQPFFSLTTGELLTIPKPDNTTDAYNTIAVYDGKMTTLYLHASKVLVEPDEDGTVQAGSLLGLQGNTSLEDIGVHVHIEVRENIWKVAAHSANDTTINPIPYLYNWVDDRTERGGTDRMGRGGADGAEEGGTDETEEFHQLDANQDGRVDPFDLLEVLRNLGTNNLQCDVTGDGKVDMADWNEIKAHLNDPPVALTRSAQNSPERKTSLLTNYPNPFNPETWIPYQLAWSADVSISIHAADGTEIRTLDLGHRPAGLYLQRSRAAYWDGRNEFGEWVASGIYFYTLSAGDFTTTRRMLISR